jgi:hypothetical protein
MLTLSVFHDIFDGKEVQRFGIWFFGLKGWVIKIRDGWLVLLKKPGS